MTVTSGQTFVTVVENKVAEVKSSSTGVLSWCGSNWKALLGEAVSTTLLVFLGCMACIPIDGHDPQPPMYGPFGFGLIVMFNVQTFGHISGAHMNPCITLLSIFWGKTSIILGIGYLIAQCIGSIFASWVLYNVSPVDMSAEAVCVTLPHERIGVWEAVVIEVVLTGALCLITCAIWDPVNEKHQDSTPIKFGLTIAGLSLAGGPLTGASMNPARSLGPAFLTGVWTSHWVYWVGPFLGAILASLVYIFTFLDRKQKNISLETNVIT